MKFPFKFVPPLVGDRPFVEFAFDQFPTQRLVGLVDTGAWYTRVSDEWAVPLGIDLSGTRSEPFKIAGATYYSRIAPVRLKVRNVTWNCDVCFTAGWNYPYQLLGLRGFFDKFSVRIDATQGITDLTSRVHT